MKRITAWTSRLVSLVLLAACTWEPTGVPATPDEGPAFASTPGATRVSVMTQNLYVGADVDAVLAALVTPDRSDDLDALITAIETLEKTHFPTRAGGIADVIARERPHVVGFQEVSEIHIDLRAMGVPITLDLDFLPILQTQLAARGLNYAVAGSIKNIDARPLPGIQLVDYDVILVDADRVTVERTHARNFAFNVGPIAEGVELKRGLVAVTAAIDGQRYQFLNTHLEPDLGARDLSDLRAAQAYEATAVLGNHSPAFVMGDLNDVPGSPMYQVLVQAGFDDVWAELRPGVDGSTTPRSADLANPHDNLTRRIDYLWARGVGHAMAGLQGRIALIGAVPSDMVEGPYYRMWPSDHVGLVAELLVPPAALAVSAPPLQ